MVRVTMIYDTNDIGTINHPIMSIELDDEITKHLRSKKIEVNETTLFIGQTAKIQIEDIEIEIRTSRIQGYENGLMRQLSAQ